MRTSRQWTEDLGAELGSSTVVGSQGPVAAGVTMADPSRFQGIILKKMHAPHACITGRSSVCQAGRQTFPMVDSPSNGLDASALPI